MVSVQIFMKKLVFISLFIALLTGCSSSSDFNVERYSDITAGVLTDDVSSLLWLTQNQLGVPHSAADYVVSNKTGWYKTEYRWEDNTLRALVREGEKLNSDQKLVPFRVHVRFNQAGDAIYQQYRIDGRVLPLQNEAFSRYINQAKELVKKAQQQARSREQLIQGYWRGQYFETCAGRKYSSVQFTQALPNAVMQRLATMNSYAAFTGKLQRSKLEVDKLLIMDDESHQCITRPKLLEQK